MTTSSLFLEDQTDLKYTNSENLIAITISMF